MKNKIILLGAFLFMFCTITSINAQINRTLETKVADILAQMPTRDLSHSDRLMESLLDLETEGILQFCKMLVPNEVGNDVQVRYALNSLAIYMGGKQNSIENNIVENAFIKAIDNSTDNEVKIFLIRRLAFCGSNTSVGYLSKYLLDENLYKPALATLTYIGTQEAAQSIYEATKNADSKFQPALIGALGTLRFEPAAGLLERLSNSNSVVIRQKSLMALAEIALEQSEKYLFDAAKAADFKLDESRAIISYIEYGKRLNEKGLSKSGSKVGKNLLKYCNSESQLHFRSAGLSLLSENKGSSFTKTLIKESRNLNNNYRGAVVEIAAKRLTSSDVTKWVKAYSKSSDEARPQIIRLLSKRTEPDVYDKCIISAVKGSASEVRIAGIKALAFQDKSKAFPLLLESLKHGNSENEYKAIEETLLRVCDAADNELLVQSLKNMNDNGKVVLLNVLASRSAKAQFLTITSLMDGGSDIVKSGVYAALPKISTDENLVKLIDFLGLAEDSGDIDNTQKAIIQAIDNSSEDHSKLIVKAFKSNEDKAKVLPILAVLSDQESLDLIIDVLKSSSQNEKKIALETLTNWRNNDAIAYLFLAVVISNNEELRAIAFDNYLTQVNRSSFPDDQKLLLIKNLMPYSISVDEKKEIIKSARGIKTFLSLVFVSKYMDSKGLETTAANTAIRIALPSPGKKNGLSGDVVREIVSKGVGKLSGQDSQYIKIDVKEFLDKMNNEKGFVSIFNGKDLMGWKGLVKNPIERNKMSKRSLARAQAKSNKQMLKDWFVEDGAIGFKGEGYNNICTIKDYGDFEMIVDWKITKGGDSGIYLRGTPQVQIWDIARVDAGAQVGSGGLYNNQKHEKIPLVVADNPINEWNTFRIKMVGERVTVHLNGVLVTDNVILDNYWDRKNPIFTKEAIELQAHGEDLGFRNIYIREINSGDDLLSKSEQEEGFQSLFNGKDLDHWIGNKVDYYAENNEILARPNQGGHGNLFTAEEYSDFIFRFEFKLTPGANNGLGIHAPLKGDVAYEGKEIQILDNTAAIYANLKPYQYHGSVYGVIMAKRGFLNPVGEWNSEEVHVNGNEIKVTLNGTVILDGDMKEASKNGTLDGKDHPGLKRNTGHIGFLGHGSELEFRNLRIKDLNK